MAGLMDEKMHGLDNPAEPTPLMRDSDSSTRLDVAGSVMDGLAEDVDVAKYTVYKSRWLMLAFFVVYSASNSLQWTQYTIIQDVVVRYYGVASNVVSWTSIVYMITYVPLIFPASWLLDKTNFGVSKMSVSVDRQLTSGFSKMVNPIDVVPIDIYNISGSVKDGSTEDVSAIEYTVHKSRWVMLALFVVYSASNSLQWMQYTIIQDIVVGYYGVESTVVSWTSMVYMVTYVPLIFPASWLLDKTVAA
ncbi:unnamed protein product, partial [Iphiclides podalirius]